MTGTAGEQDRPSRTDEDGRGSRHVEAEAAVDGTGTGTAGGPRVVAGRYALLAPLGVGGMATVWRARDELLGREVAVKEVVAPHGLSDADRDVLFERTRREARAAARLDHPSAVTVYDVVEDGGSPFLVMELVPARTLAEVVKGEGPLDPRQAAEVGLAVLGALEAAHARGIVHRDVKPSNVLLGGDRTAPGRVVLTDFGIATSAGDASITSTGLLLGSPSYISPERARGRAPGPASDLWSLGATLFTAVEGRPPYDAGDPLSTVTAVVTGEHEPFVRSGPLEPVITGLLVRDPAERLDAASVRVMLEQVLAEAPRTTGSYRVPGARTTTEGRREDADAVSRAQRTSALPAAPAAQVRPRTSTEDRAPGRRPAPSRPARPAPSRLAGPAPVARPVRRRRAVVLAVLAALLVAATAAAGTVLLQRGDRDGSAAPRPSSSGTSASPSPTPSAAAARPAGVPADWASYTHPAQGWTAWFPSSYSVSDRGSLKQVRDESTRYTLRISEGGAGQNAVATEQAFATSVAGQLGGYAQVRLDPVAFRGWDAAELEFTYSDSGADLHVLNRTFVAGGRTYSLYWQTNADRFAASLPEFERIAAAFTPAP